MKNIMEKRYKEIQEMAKAYASHMTSDKDMQVAFAYALRRGAEWANRTMINKACEWLERALPLRPDDRDEFIEQFKQVMKGD